jgi:hypothetical protein
MDPLFRLLEEVGGRDWEERYGEGIELLVRVPSNRLQYLRTRIAEITAGAGVVQEITG